MTFTKFNDTHSLVLINGEQQLIANDQMFKVVWFAKLEKIHRDN